MIPIMARLFDPCREAKLFGGYAIVRDWRHNRQIRAWPCEAYLIRAAATGWIPCHRNLSLLEDNHHEQQAIFAY